MHNVETMMWAGETPWHRLGTQVPTNVPWQEAIGAAGLDWTVSTVPLVARPRPTIDPLAVDVHVPGFRAVVRDTDESPLGIVSSSYEPIQNRDAFALFGEAFGDAAVLHTAGSLRGGRDVWGLAEIPGEYKVAGEEHRRYMLLSTTHDGSGSLNLRLSDTRVVCWNTLQIALREASGALDLRVAHRGDVTAALANAGDVLAVVFRRFERHAETMGLLAEIRLEAARRAELVRSIVDPEGETESKRIDAMCAEILRLCSEGTGNEPVGETAYGVLQGVTDYVDHHRMLGAEPERRFLYQTEGAGARLKARALSTLTALVA